MKITARLAGLVGVLFVLMLVLALSGCVHGGILTMDDQWCAAHPHASKVHCMRPKSALLVAPPSLPEGKESMNEAATYALAAAYQRAHYYEYGGVIVHLPNGQFATSRPMTKGHADNIEIDEDPESYGGHFPIVADYHTHPCLAGYVSEVFSPADLRSMREMNRPGYILDECKGDVHYWQPGDPYDDADAEDELFGTQTASGRIVGHIPVDGIEIKL